MEKEVKTPKQVELFSKKEINEILNTIQKQSMTKNKWFEMDEDAVLFVQPRLDLYLKSLQLSTGKHFQNRNLLYDYYFTTLLIDDVVFSLIDKRLDNITNKTLQIVDNNNVVDEKYKYFLDAPKFRLFIKDLVMTKFYGFNLFGFKKYEYEDKLWFDYVQINHKHVDPFNGHVTKTQYSSDPIFKYAEHPEFLFIGSADDLGIMAKVTKLSIMLRHGDFLYGKYADLASENFTHLIKKGLVDEAKLREIIKQMQVRAGGGTIETDNNIEIKRENQSSSQQNALFEGFLKEKRERLSVLILGQTMTTQDGSSRAQAEVHEDEQDDKYSSDEQYVLDVLNYEFVDYMKLWFPDWKKEGKRFKFLPKSNDEIIKKLRYYEKLKNLGIVFNDDELRTKFKELL